MLSDQIAVSVRFPWSGARKIQSGIVIGSLGFGRLPANGDHRLAQKNQVPPAWRGPCPKLDQKVLLAARLSPCHTGAAASNGAGNVGNRRLIRFRAIEFGLKAPPSWAETGDPHSGSANRSRSGKEWRLMIAFRPNADQNRCPLQDVVVVKSSPACVRGHFRSLHVPSVEVRPLSRLRARSK